MAGAPTSPAGWYENPEHAGQMRWWDGSSWTNEVRADGQVSFGSPPPPGYAPAGAAQAGTGGAGFALPASAAGGATQPGTGAAGFALPGQAAGAGGFGAQQSPYGYGAAPPPGGGFGQPPPASGQVWGMSRGW